MQRLRGVLAEVRAARREARVGELDRTLVVIESEELFRRSQKGCVVPWGPSYQWADASRQLPTFATVPGFTLVALAKPAFDPKQSAPVFMPELANINATLVRASTGQPGRRPRVMLPPELSPSQQKAVQFFELDLWMPSFYSTRN